MYDPFILSEIMEMGAYCSHSETWHWPKMLWKLKIDLPTLNTGETSADFYEKRMRDRLESDMLILPNQSGFKRDKEFHTHGLMLKLKKLWR